MSLSAPVAGERPVTLLRYFDVVVLVVAAPIMLLIGVPANGYLIGAGVWIALRAVGVGVDHWASNIKEAGPQISLRLCYMLGRLFLLAITVIIVRKDAGQDAGLTCLAVIVFAFTVRADGVSTEPPEAEMSNGRKIFFGILGFYLGGLILLLVIFGFGHKNNEFQIQNEFKLDNWVHLGVFSINRAVLYLFIADDPHRR